MVTTNASNANGVNVGFNLQMYGDTAVPPGKASGNNCMGLSGGPNCTRYRWYAGNVNVSTTGAASGVPIEFGSANLISTDPLEQQPHAMIGSLIIEPPATLWCNSAKTMCSSAMGTATVGPVYDTTVTSIRAVPVAARSSPSLSA